MNNKNNLFLKCGCYGHLLEVEKVDKDEWYISCWHYGNVTRPLSWKERIRWCWRILKTGNPWADQVILNNDDIFGLLEFLKKDEYISQNYVIARWKKYERQTQMDNKNKFHILTNT